MTELPRPINPQWLLQKTTLLGCTAKTVGGEPNPNYIALAAEVAEAEAEYQRWTAFLAWAKARNLILNQYRTSVAGKRYEAGQVFLTAKDASGRRDNRTIADVWAEYLETKQRERAESVRLPKPSQGRLD